MTLADRLREKIKKFSLPIQVWEGQGKVYLVHKDDLKYHEDWLVANGFVSSQDS